MLTIGIANKDFGDMRRFKARFNFSCTLIGNHPGERSPLRDNHLLAIPQNVSGHASNHWGI